ncbi:MAG: CAP domain-containing protein [Bacteroidetes bacterium]|nr:CAP domain-containing protein [Bacteroidota bacterium]MBU1720490.1 CAP domain-containing protein [Bacteroidota bacterium]
MNFAFSQQNIPLSKDQVTDLYTKLYATSEISAMGWNGNVEKCRCGSVQKDIFEKAENRINFFRLVNGLQKVKHNAAFDQEAQDAALLIKASNQLTHHPVDSLKCYNQSAADGCLKSCLAFTDFVNYPRTAFITGFIWDFGDENYFVGHRKWLLYSRLISFGYGATDISETVHVSDGATFDTLTQPEFIAYPWHGYVPVDLIFAKWSFAIPEGNTVDFSNTTVTMLDYKGQEIKLKVLEEYPDYLDPTIVWTALGLFTDYEISYGINKMAENGFLNRKIKVYIRNVLVNGKLRTYEYFVEPIRVQ